MSDQSFFQSLRDIEKKIFGKPSDPLFFLSANCDIIRAELFRPRGKLPFLNFANRGPFKWISKIGFDFDTPKWYDFNLTPLKYFGLFGVCETPPLDFLKGIKLTAEGYVIPTAPILGEKFVKLGAKYENSVMTGVCELTWSEITPVGQIGGNFKYGNWYVDNRFIFDTGNLGAWDSDLMVGYTLPNLKVTASIDRQKEITGTLRYRINNELGAIGFVRWASNAPLNWFVCLIHKNEDDLTFKAALSNSSNVCLCYSEKIFHNLTGSVSLHFNAKNFVLNETLLNVGVELEFTS